MASLKEASESSRPAQVQGTQEDQHMNTLTAAVNTSASTQPQTKRKSSSSMSSNHCCVPGCSNNAHKRKDLSFHAFPIDQTLRDQWIWAIKRDEGPTFTIARGSTFLCSEHFDPGDLKKSTNPNGRTRLNQGAVPSRFSWNEYGKGSKLREPAYERARKRLCAAVDERAETSVPGDNSVQGTVQRGMNSPEDCHTHSSTVDECAEMPIPGDSTDNSSQRRMDSPEDRGHSSRGATPQGTEYSEQRRAVVLAKDHDYDYRPSPAKLDTASKLIRELELKIIFLEMELQEMKLNVQQQPVIFQYCVTDEDFRYYTRFSSKEVFTVFWESIKPSAERIIYWTKAQRTTQDDPSPCRKLPLIDEFFLFLCRIAAGLQERTLATIFKVSQSTVSRAILTWTSYLFLVLGSLPIWMTREMVQSTMPDKFKLYCPEVRVIIDCTEIRCESPSSLSLQSETFSSYKNHTTFKGLIGIAPCGVFTFISKLYTGSISDKEITRKSQLLQLLQPGDGVMADKGFLIEEMLSEVGATLTIPPLKRSDQLSAEDTRKTQEIARLRVLVERAIRRVKEFHIWDGVVPLSLTGSVNQMWAICCILTNYQGPLDIKGDKPV